MLSLPIVATLLFSVTFVAEKILLWGHKAAKSGRDWDRSSLLVFDVSGVLSVPLGVAVGFTGFGRIDTGCALVSLCGDALMLCGTALRWRAILTLKNYFTVNVAILENHRIVRDGLYGYLRHPSYTGLLIRYFGFGLAYANCLSLALIFLPMLGAILYRIHVEEAALSEAFGDEYAEYRKATSRLIPKVY